MSSELVAGFKRLKDCKPGQLVRFESGTFVLLAEYRTFNGGLSAVWDGYIVGSGEAFHPKDPNEWVAIVDMGWLEIEIDENEIYPPKSIPLPIKDSDHAET